MAVNEEGNEVGVIIEADDLLTQIAKARLPSAAEEPKKAPRKAAKKAAENGQIRGWRLQYIQGLDRSTAAQKAQN